MAHLLRERLAQRQRVQVLEGHHRRVGGPGDAVQPATVRRIGHREIPALGTFLVEEVEPDRNAADTGPLDEHAGDRGQHVLQTLPAASRPVISRSMLSCEAGSKPVMGFQCTAPGASTTCRGRRDPSWPKVPLRPSCGTAADPQQTAPLRFSRISLPITRLARRVLCSQPARNGPESTMEAGA